jgi:4-amino-4-deoxy-L-arabinose transferase-like glycosyltransferase
MTAMREHRVCLLSIAALIALRVVAGAVLPLSADEAYYWLWSKHLAAGYYDHPPAIAFLIRVGVIVFGDTSFGVRLVPLLLSIAASWFVWRAGALVLKDKRACALSCLLFNLTLMVAVETMAATPDAPLIACAAAFLWTLAKVDETQNGRWWLAVGAAGGLALLSKYTAFFLGAGALAWIVFVPSARRWLLSPWPYLGAVLAFAIFAPNLIWNAQHHWMTFAFQFGRVGAGRFTLRFLFEFLGAQLLLATPFILVCSVFGLWRKDTALLAATILPSVAYFAIHSLHDRVQGNWPCFLYPALAVAAAAAMASSKGWLESWSARLAIPVAALLLALCYAQAFFGVLPIGRKDPFARLLASGFVDVARQADSLHPAAILTTDYETTAWLAFYGRGPVIQLNEEGRWPTSQAASGELLGGSLIYIVPQSRDRHDFVRSHFQKVVLAAPIDRQVHGQAIEHYDVYRVEGLRGAPLGRLP